jgi:two-component SAPR family response regulator
MYYNAIDHDTEDCITLYGKIQEKHNHNNQNVQWITTKAREERRKINIVMGRGAKKGDDVAKQEPVQHQWIKKNT